MSNKHKFVKSNLGKVFVRGSKQRIKFEMTKENVNWDQNYMLLAFGSNIIMFIYLFLYII